jgi:hypothetical protein
MSASPRITATSFPSTPSPRLNSAKVQSYE